MVEVVAQIMSACHLYLRLARLSRICPGRRVPLLAATSLPEDQMACPIHKRLRETQATSVEVGEEEIRGMMETVDLADIEAVHPRTVYLEHQYGHARTKQCMAEMEQQSDLGLMTHSLIETWEEAVHKPRRTSVVELAQRGETHVPMKLRGTREDLAETEGSIEIGEESLIRETEVIEEMGGREETAVGAEESAEEAAMKAKGSEALQITKGHGDDMLG